MPYKSQAQSRYIHMKANEGAPWAKRFAKDSHGQVVKNLAERKAKKKRKHKGFPRVKK